MRTQIPIQDFKKLVFLFNAGAGEFHFLNDLTKNQFNVKFIPTTKDGWSRVEVCYSKYVIKLFYNHIGRYNFKEKTLELRNYPVMTDFGIKRTMSGLGFILDHINSGKNFSPNILAYYSGHCCRCGQQLTNKESLSIGLGPNCEEFYKEEVKQFQFSLF